MKYFTFQYKKYGILNTSASKYCCLLWFSLLSFFTSQAQNQFDLRFQLNTVDCAQATACFDVQIRSANGQNWGLAGQNYRIYYDGNLANFQAGSSQLSNQYEAFMLVQNEQGINASTTGSALSFENNLSFLNYQIDLVNPETGGVNLLADGTWLTTSQLCFAVDAAVINDPNTCLEAIWAKEGLTQEYATAFVEIAEWAGFCETVPAIGAAYDNLESGDGDAACFNLSCPIINSPVADNASYDIRLQAGALDCSNNTICYDVQLRNPTNEPFNLAGQNYRLYYDGAIASWQSGISFLDNNYQDFTLIENSQNVNTNTPNSNLNFENNLSFLNYTMDLNEVMLGGTNLPTDGTWFTTSQLCFAIQEVAINDPNTCLEAIWARDGLTQEYATAFVEVAEWTGMMDTEIADGVGYDDLDAADGQGACFMDICTPDTLDLALFKNLANPNLTSIALGDDVVYKIGVVNEGNVTVESVTITDNLPDGTALSSADTSNWTVNNSIATKILAGPLAPGDTLCAYIVLKIIYGSPNQVIFNTAEIIEVQHMNVSVFLDIDSTPNEDDEVNEDDEDSAVITIAPSCSTIDLAESVTICEGGNVQLNPVLSTPTAGTFTWSPALGLDSPNNQNPIASPTETTVYTVTFSDGNDCEVTATTTINVGNDLAISLTPDSGVCANTPFQLLAAGGMTYNWSPATGLNQNNIANPIATITNTMTYSVTVSDGICTTTETVTLTVDNEAPTFNTTVQDVVINCNENTPTIPTISATDNLDNAPNIELIENMSAPNVCPVIMSRIWIATDNCGNQNTMIQMITVVDNQIPVFDNIPADLNLTCGEILPTPINPTVTDNCDNQPVIELMETTTGTDCNQQITRTWTATDNCGNIALATQIISIQDSEAPKLTGIPDDTGVNCNNIPDPATPTVSDDCDTSVDITFAENQNGSGCNFTLIRTWTATDNCGNTVVKTQNIQVQDNSAPVFVSVPADITVSCGNPVPTATNPVVTDNCDTEVLALASETTIPNDCGFTILRTWTATDDCGNSATAEQTVFVSDVGQPIFSGSPADLTIDCSEVVPTAAVLTAQNECNNNPISVTFTENTATDDCGLTITRIWSATDDCGNVGTVDQVIMVMDLEVPVFSNVPTNLVVECGAAIPNSSTPTAIDACDGDVEIAFAETESGTDCNQQITRTWTATDDCGNLATAIQTISVQDNIAPILTGIPLNQIVNCGTIPDPANPIATDNCDTNIAVVFTEEQTGTGCQYTLIRTWTATDNCGNATVETQLIQFEDSIAPMFTSSFPDININCSNGQNSIPTPTATDNCPNGLTIAFEENMLNGNCASGLNKIRTWIATDNCGNTTTATQNITIQDDSLPILGGIPADLSLDCNDIPPPAIPIATDACDTNVEIIFEETQMGTGCEYSLIRTWTAIDDCGNSVSESQTINVNDSTPPVITPTASLLLGVSSGDTLIMQCGATDIFGDNDAIATDACDSNPFIELIEGNIIVSTCADDDFLVWMECYWEATDACGNTSQFLIYIKVIDTTLPQFSTVPTNVTLSCEEAIPTNLTPTVSDNCTSVTNLQVIEQEDIILGNCEGERTIIRTWIAIDQCGNSNTFNQTILIQDNLAPEILGSPADLTIDESVGQTIPFPAIVTAEDNCSQGITVVFNQTETQGDCEQIIIRTWSATDDCGNVTTVSQTITVLEDCEDCVVPVVENISISPTICNQSTGTANIDLVGNESDYTFTWIPDFGMPITAINNARTNLPAGNYLVVINYQGQADCEDKVEFTIEDDCPTPPQSPLLIADFEAIGFKCESTNPIYCLDIPFNEINDFTIKVNGIEFHDFSAGCDFEQTHGYSFSSLGGNGNIGNFVLDSWIVDGQDYNTTFSTTTELVDFMNAKDPEGFWYFNQTTLIVTGEITGKTYGSMNIRHLPTGITSILVLNTNTFATGTQLNISKDGMHEIVVTRNADQAKDTLQLMAICMTTDTIFSILELGQSDEVCLSKEELYGDLHTIKKHSIGNSVVDITVVDELNACFNCIGKAIGTNENILVICDEYDICDTTYVITEVRAVEETQTEANDLIVYSGFSPNGDGINDHFTIVGLDKQHGYQLSVFNRWGERVFQSQDYQNDWDATHNGANLPDGTYFYVLKIKDGKPHSGYIQIHR